MKRRQAAIYLLALVMVAAAALTPALAYFTDRSQADGRVPLRLRGSSEITETFGDWVKHVSITNTEGAPVYVRAQVFAGSTYTLAVSGDGWTQNADGYWYYGSPVAEGASAAALNVAISGMSMTPSQSEAAFNVAVVYETVAVSYDANGDPLPVTAADWDTPLDTGTSEGGNGNG